MFFFFNDTATTEIYTLSLHDALPIYNIRNDPGFVEFMSQLKLQWERYRTTLNVVDRKSTRLNSSHLVISYAVFCLKKKKMRPQDRAVRARMPPQLRRLAGAPPLQLAH